MKMEQYLAHTDYALWKVILNGNSAVQMSKDEAGNEIEVPPVTAHQILARTKEKKAKITLLMAIPDEHLARFYGIKDAKNLWVAIKTRFVGNAESKKMQKNILKQQFENFSVSNSDGLDKGYDRFQRLLSLLEIHRACIDTLDIDDLYNNLKVYEADIKGSSRSSSNSQNAAFVSVKSTSSTNELNTAYSVSTATGHSSQAQGSSSYDDELMFLFFANQSSTPQLDKEDLEQINQYDLEEMDLISRRRDNGKRPAKEEDAQALLDEALKEKEDLKAKLEKFETSSKNLTNLLDSKTSAKVKTGLGYDSQFNEKEVLDTKEEEVTETVFDNRSSDEENSVANDRFKKCEGYHAVPPPLTGNYMPPKPDMSFAGLDDSIYKFKISETVTSLAKDENDAPKTSTAFVEKPKEDRSSAPLIEDWEIDSDDDNIFTLKPIRAKIDFVKPGGSIKHVKPVESVKHVKPVTPVKTAKQTEKSKNFIFIRSGRIPVSAAKPKAAATTSTTKPVNTAGPKQSVTFSRTTISAFKRNGVTAIKTSAGNKAYLADYQEIHDGGFVDFGSSRGKITGKGTIRTRKLDFDNVYFVNKLKFNLFSVSQMCDKKNSVLFTETECLVLSPNFKLLDERQVLLRVLKQSNMYSFDLQNVVPSGDLTCLFAKASIDESNL
uniref:Ribonuclease H-like domain-containing protein n=1 Tax=Tanacetum cinerariifolium TaxID=118510 RepID=A0A6L2L311_TANCI|nr:ribonuclease H-like domain-containing protein [Tanacetum cinerariifolium]